MELNTKLECSSDVADYWNEHRQIDGYFIMSSSAIESRDVLPVDAVSVTSVLIAAVRKSTLTIKPSIHPDKPIIVHRFIDDTDDESLKISCYPGNNTVIVMMTSDHRVVWITHNARHEGTKDEFLRFINKEEMDTTYLSIYDNKGNHRVVIGGYAAVLYMTSDEFFEPEPAEDDSRYLTTVEDDADIHNLVQSYIHNGDIFLSYWEYKAVKGRTLNMFSTSTADMIKELPRPAIVTVKYSIADDKPIMTLVFLCDKMVVATLTLTGRSGIVYLDLSHSTNTAHVIVNSTISELTLAEFELKCNTLINPDGTVYLNTDEHRGRVIKGYEITGYLPPS